MILSFLCCSIRNTIVSNKEYGIEKAIVLCNDNVRQDGPITYLPIYMSMFITNNDVKLPSSEKQSLGDI